MFFEAKKRIESKDGETDKEKKETKGVTERTVEREREKERERERERETDDDDKERSCREKKQKDRRRAVRLLEYLLLSRMLWRRWAMVSTVQWENSLRMVVWIRSSVSRSTAAVASSRTRIRLFLSSARARHSSCL